MEDENPNSLHRNINHQHQQHQQHHFHGNGEEVEEADLRLANLDNPEEMDESQRAIVTEMCNVVWKKLGDERTSATKAEESGKVTQA